MKRIITAVLISLTVSSLLIGCSGCSSTASKNKPAVYEASFFTLFDTVTTVKGTAESEEKFHELANQIYSDLEKYHRLFDIYNDYPGVNNIKTVNDRAGAAPVEVSPEIIAFLKDCIGYYELTGGKTNVAMGSVLSLWHEARSEGIDDPLNARLPDTEKLSAAAEHIQIGCLVIDEENSTVYLSDPAASLDVGAAAKGWSVQRIAESVPSGIILSVGGNVCATGPKYESTPWVIGIRDPRGSADDYLHTVYVDDVSVVTSGDYQRGYTVDGRMYHHIIDPETCMPSEYWSSVTVVCDDSGLADALSTALFLLPLEDGQALAEKCDVDVFWVGSDGEEFMTPGFRQLIKT